MELRNVEDLLKAKLKPGVTVKSFSTKALTSVGDNYGSTMYALSVELKNENSEEEEESLELVAKMLPTNPDFYNMFQVDKTFVKESCIYTIVAPKLRSFQLDKNIPENQLLDVFCECYGARLSLDPMKTTLDNDAVLILENLKVKGYKVGDRSEGFDLEHSEFVLRNLAHFHAVPIAFRRERPDDFQQNILPHLKKLDMDAGLKKETYEEMIQALFNELLSVPELVPMMELLKKQIDLNCQRAGDLEFIEESPFNTFCHFDFWVNNMMICEDNDCHPKRIKIVDYQFIKYGSVAEDVLFFIFTSVADHLLDSKIDHLLDVYYTAFYEALRINGCPLEDYSKQSFLEEINRMAKWELYHLISMTKVLKFDKEKLSAMEEISEDMITSSEILGADYFQKLKLIVFEFKNRGWLMSE